MNIVLIGFRGTGKTTIGKLLATKLGMRFADTDELVEKRYGFTINEMFVREGESQFRLWESDLISEVSKNDSYVIAAGGGAIMKYKNVKNLKRRGVLFLLEASPRTIYKRIMADDKTISQRPPLTGRRTRLTGNELYNEIRRLLEFRHRYYVEASDYVINTTDKTSDKILEEIVDCLRAAGYVPP